LSGSYRFQRRLTLLKELRAVLQIAALRHVGAALLSVDSQELINTVALAMRHDVTAREVRDAIYTHPSSTEAFNEVLGTPVRGRAR